MKQGIFQIAENVQLVPGVFRLRLRGELPAGLRPGQFAGIMLDSAFLRRPFSVCDGEWDTLTVIYKTVGRGTKALSRLGPGTALDVLSGLGNGFDLNRAGDRPALLAGGVGLTPLYFLAKVLAAGGLRPRVLLGFNTAAEVFYEREFRALGCAVTVCTVDGSYGEKGFVTQYLPEDTSCFYACGPEPMLEALCKAAKCPGELSLEARMGCGFGACMGCTRQTASGPKRVCKDGPVFRKEELLWPTQG